MSHQSKLLFLYGLIGAPMWIRTTGLPLRRGTLYPAELWGRNTTALDYQEPQLFANLSAPFMTQETPQ